MKRFFIGLAILAAVIAIGRGHADGAPLQNIQPTVAVANVEKVPPRVWQAVKVRGETINIPTSPEKRCPKFEPLFRKMGLKPVQVWSYIAWRESRCRPEAVNAIWRNGKIVWTLNKNGTFDSGLLQINSSWTSVTAQVCKSKWGDLTVLRNPECNLKVARYLFDNGGLHHWGF